MVFAGYAFAFVCIAVGIVSLLLAYAVQACTNPRRALRYDTMPTALQRSWIFGVSLTSLGLCAVLLLSLIE